MMDSFLLDKIRTCVVERRMPSIATRKLESIKSFLYPYKGVLDVYLGGVFLRGLPSKKIEDLRCLYVTAVNREGKPLLEKIIRTMDLPNVDYLAFCYDDTSFEEPLFSKVKVRHESGSKWRFSKKYLTPEFCKDYDYIFIWDDDLEVEGFSFKRFIDVMRKNRVEYCQPALTLDSHINIDITRVSPGSVGRFTDYVENMAPVFTRAAWLKYWNAIDETTTFWGGQYTECARFVCGYKRMGIIDTETISHTRPGSSWGQGAKDELFSFFDSHPEIQRSKRMVFAAMR